MKRRQFLQTVGAVIAGTAIPAFPVTIEKKAEYVVYIESIMMCNAEFDFNKEPIILTIGYDKNNSKPKIEHIMDGVKVNCKIVQKDDTSNMEKV